MTMPEQRAVVLVHGSWMGGWCWRALAGRLSAAGLPAHTPTLAGLAERAGAETMTIGLHDHVAEIGALLDRLAPARAILVGHSYGGAVAAEAAAGRTCVERLVILDGFIPAAGKSLFDLHPQVEALLRPLIDPARPGLVQPPAPAMLLAAGETLDDAALEPLTPMPLGTHEQKARYDAAALECPVTYVGFSRFPPLAPLCARAGQLGWDVADIDAGHLAILTHPERVADAILTAAEGKQP